MPRLNDLAHGRLDAPKLDPRDITVRTGFNYRDITSEAVQAHIDWLEQSIRENGVEKPISVEFDDGKAYLVDGQCRLEACKRLRKKGLEIYIPAMQVKGDEPTILATSMIANGSLPPTVLEFGKAAAKLIGYGWTEEQIAQYVPPHIGLTAKKAKKYVRDAVELHQAPVAVKEAVAHGVDGVAVSPALAVQATRKNRMYAEEQIKDAAKQAKEHGQKTAKRSKGAGRATRAKEAKETLQSRLNGIGDRMADGVIDYANSGGTVSPDVKGAAHAWRQLRNH